VIYYLAQKYSGSEEQAFRDACLWVSELRAKKAVVFSPILHTHPYDINTPLAHENEDYVAWDLAICEGFLKPVTYSSYANVAKNLPDFNEGLTMLFAASCFNNQFDENGIMMDDEQWEWASKGAKTEYNWAKKHHVRCLLLEPFLEGKEVEI
jgi:hypothetical protein